MKIRHLKLRPLKSTTYMFGRAFYDSKSTSQPLLTFIEIFGWNFKKHLINCNRYFTFTLKKIHWVIFFKVEIFRPFFILIFFKMIFLKKNQPNKFIFFIKKLFLKTLLQKNLLQRDILQNPINITAPTLLFRFLFYFNKN